MIVSIQHPDPGPCATHSRRPPCRPGLPTAPRPGGPSGAPSLDAPHQPSDLPDRPANPNRPNRTDPHLQRIRPPHPPRPRPHLGGDRSDRPAASPRHPLGRGIGVGGKPAERLGDRFGLLAFKPTTSLPTDQPDLIREPWPPGPPWPACRWRIAVGARMPPPIARPVGAPAVSHQPKGPVANASTGMITRHALAHVGGIHGRGADRRVGGAGGEEGDVRRHRPAATQTRSRMRSGSWVADRARRHFFPDRGQTTRPADSPGRAREAVAWHSMHPTPKSRCCGIAEPALGRVGGEVAAVWGRLLLVATLAGGWA